MMISAYKMFFEAGGLVKHISKAFVISTAILAGLSVPPISAQELTRYVYNARGEVVRVETPLANTDYSYDKASNREFVKQRTLFPTSWMAKDLYHTVGYGEAGGWAANVTNGTGHMTYGPYTPLAAGSYTATWRMMVDVVNAADDDVVTIEVYDATAGQFLAQATLKRSRFVANFVYQVFELPFTISAARAGHAIELRTFYHSKSYTRIEKVGYHSS